MKALRFFCFNIHGGRSLDGKRDLGRVNALLDQHDIDIAVFQEVETRPFMGGEPEDVAFLAGPSRPHHLQGPSMTHGGGWYGNLIVSRYPIIRGIVHNLETSLQFEPRNAVDALIETPAGNIRVIGTHLSLSPFERWSEARNLMNLIETVEEREKNPVFLMGDINEWLWRPKLLRHLNGLMTPLPCKPTFPSRLPFLRLDRAWYDPHDAKVPIRAEARTLTGKNIRLLSDHLPVVVEAAFG